MAVKVNG